MRLLTLAVMLTAASPALAWDEDYRHGRIRYVEPGVALQRSDEANADEAVANFPFLPGDRVWTDGGGRVEFQFQDGTLLRLDSRSKVDYVAHEEGDERVILRLWSGSAWLVTRDRGN
jgi:FecR protein